MEKTTNLIRACNVLSITMVVGMLQIVSATAQNTDTVYFNDKWEKTDWENRHFYRVIIKNDSLPTIWVRDFYPNHTKQMDGWYNSMEPEVRHGDFTWWYEDGKKHREMTFENGDPTKIIEWDSDGKITRQQVAVKTVSYLNGEAVYERKSLEKFPAFNRGKSSIADYTAQHLKYPAGANGLAGKVIVRFVVDKNGRTRNVEVTQGIHEVLDKAAVEFVKSLPRWTPGVLDGKNVNIKMELPVIFRP